MQSPNFGPLENIWPELYKHAIQAEGYVYDDPAAATIKLRCFVETLVGLLYRELELRSEQGDGLFERLKSESFESVVESPIRQKLHAIRCYGNKAAHGGEIDNEQAVRLLKEAYLLGRWLFSTYSEDGGRQYPGFVIPAPPGRINKDLNAENQRLARQLEEAKRGLGDVQASEQEALAQIADLSSTLDEARLSVFRNAASRASSNMNLEEEATRRLLNIQDAFGEYSLTDGQTELIKQLGKFLSSNNEGAFLLRGYAGTGKTFITRGLTEYFRSIGRNYVLAAPTGKAAKVIAEKTKSNAFTLHRTIYSFKDISEFKDEDLDGTETYKFYAELAVNELPADTVFIVDEASMVSDAYTEAEFFRFGSGYVLRDFLKYVNLDHNDHRKKVIFIGDDAQLPPVGMPFSPALDAAYLSTEHNVRSTSYELTEVVRQKAESGVMGNSIMLRNALKKGVFNQLSVDFQASDVAPVAHGDLMDRYLESCGNKINGESIVIAYSNADVAAYNRRIREHFFPGCEEVSVGDKVIAVNNSNAYGFFISNGDFGVIKKILRDTERRTVTIKRKQHATGEVENISVPLCFKDVIVGFRDLEGIAQFFQAKILEDLLYSDQPSFSSDENKALYLDFCIRHPNLRRGSLEFKNTLMSDPYFNALRLKFGYAITCHKAQGSEWNNVFVKCKANQNQLTAAYFRWLYTAITRTSQRLWLLDPPDIRIGSGLKPVCRPGIGVQVTASTAVSMPVEHVSISVPETWDATYLSNGRAQESLAVHQATPDETKNTFGIPESAPFLLGVLARVRELIAAHDISIDGIAHQQYQEAYTFRRANDFARVDLGYSSKEKIIRVTAPVPTELSSAVQNLLVPLVGVPIAGENVVAPEQVSFDEDFMNDFHQRLLPLAADQSITIQNVEKFQWHLRYRFARGSDVAVCDIFFNGKQRFKKYQPLITACSPGPLLPDVEALLTRGLN
jgi:tRNA A37 threonylcarbamoyladenosine biosynthesis protein TsaE